MNLLKLFKIFICGVLVACMPLSFVNAETVTSTSTPTAWPTAHMDYRISIAVRPDVTSSNPEIKKGFEVIIGSYSGITSESGECSNTVYPGNTYDVMITKDNYLKRIKKADPAPVPGSYYCVDMWPGDVNQDNAINMTDVIEIAGAFNSLKGDSRYNIKYDFNLDDVINLEDVLIVAKHFNKTSADYEKEDLLRYAIPTPTSTHSIIVTPTPTTTEGPYPTFHRMPYDISTKMTVNTITKDTADLSVDLTVNHDAFVSSARLEYWKKSNPENKISSFINLVKNYSGSEVRCTSDFHVTGLEGNTAYCYQLITNVNPNGEIQTAPYDYYWSHGASEENISSLYEFTTLSQ